MTLRGAWDDQAENWLRWARTPGHDSYWRFHGSRFVELVPPPGRLTIDVGAGEGRLSRDLRRRGHSVIAIDASDAMARACATGEEPTSAVVADAARLPIHSDAGRTSSGLAMSTTSSAMDCQCASRASIARSRLTANPSKKPASRLTHSEKSPNPIPPTSGTDCRSFCTSALRAPEGPHEARRVLIELELCAPPKLGRASLLVRYEGCDPPGTTGPEARLPCAHQGPGDSASSMSWEDGKPVHVPAPAIERSDQRADNVAAVLCNKHRIGIAIEQGAQPGHVVSRTLVRLGVAPQLEERTNLTGRSRSDQDSVRSATLSVHDWHPD